MKKFDFTFPFDPALSKNRRYVGRRSKHIASDHKSARLQAALYCKIAMKHARITKVPHTKIHVGIYVFKPNNLFDASNFVDDLIDAIQPVLKQNDRLFSHSVDWLVDRKHPRIYCCISWEVEHDQIFCSKCGNLKTKSAPCVLCGIMKGKS